MKNEMLKTKAKNALISAFSTYEKYKYKLMGVMAGTSILACGAIMFATAAPTVNDLVGKIINIICNIFLIVGIFLTVYAIGQLIMAFKNDDADSKTRASTVLVVGLVLIAIKGIVNALHLNNLVPSDWTA